MGSSGSDVETIAGSHRGIENHSKAHHSTGLNRAALRARLGLSHAGEGTPAESLAHAGTRSVAVVLLSHIPAGRRAAVEALRSPQLRHRALSTAAAPSSHPERETLSPGFIPRDEDH